jgi:hypothetical protein
MFKIQSIKTTLMPKFTGACVWNTTGEVRGGGSGEALKELIVYENAHVHLPGVISYSCA